MATNNHTEALPEEQIVQALIRFPAQMNGSEETVAEMRRILAEFKQTAEETRTALCEIRDLATDVNRQQLKKYSEKEAAAELEMSVVTLQRKRRNGDISYTRTAGGIFYLKSHLESYLLANQKLCKRDRRQTARETVS